MPVPGNHPNLCVRCVCNTGLGAGKSLPVKYAPQIAYPRTHIEKMDQIQTIKKECTQFGVVGNPQTVSRAIVAQRDMRGCEAESMRACRRFPSEQRGYSHGLCRR